MTRNFLPGRPPAGCLMASTEACGAFGRLPSQNRNVLQGEYCAPAPTADGDQKRPPSLGDASPYPFLSLFADLFPGLRENSRPYLPGEIIPDDFHLSRCYSRPTRKSELLSIYGNMAIMTHRATVSGVRNVQFRSTHVWIKRKGTWQIVAHHGSLVAPPDDGAGQ